LLAIIRLEDTENLRNSFSFRKQMNTFKYGNRNGIRGTRVHAIAIIFGNTVLHHD